MCLNAEPQFLVFFFSFFVGGGESIIFVCFWFLELLVDFVENNLCGPCYYFL